MKKRTMLKRFGLILAALGFVAISASASAEMQICTDGGLTVFDPDCDDYWFSLGGRFDIDEIVFSGNYRDRRNNFTSGANIRRGLLAFEGGVGPDWTYNVTLDFGRSLHRRRIERPTRHFIESGFTFFDEAWIGYSGLCDCTRVRVGQFTPLETLDGYANYGITNGQMFLESALATRTFSVPSYINSSSTIMKGLGIILEAQLADMFTFGATVYQPAHGPRNVFHNRRRSDRVGAAMRLTFSPVHEECLAYHFGILGRYQSLNSTRGDRFPFVGIYNDLFFTTPEVVPKNYVGVYDRGNPFASRLPFHGTIGSPILVDAGPFRAKSYNHFAGEAMGIWGPITLAGEYHYATVQRVQREPVFRTLTGPRLGKGNVHFQGGHIQGGYVLTGESRIYDFATGTLGGICPVSDCGAWEVVARASYVTLNDKDVHGGSETNVTLGVNWYINGNVRFAFNYIRANIRPTGFLTAGLRDANRNRWLHRKLDIFGLRAQVVF